MKIYAVKSVTNASGKAYVLAWSTAEGRKIQKFADPAEAIREGKVKAGQIAMGQTVAAGMSSSDRDELHAARLIAGTTPLLAALREWQKISEITKGQGLAAAQLWAQRNAAGVNRILAPAAVEKFIALKDRAGKQGTRTYGSKLKPIKAQFETRYLDAIVAADWTAYLEQYQNGVTRNDFRKRAIALCRWAQKAGHLPRGIVPEIELTDRANEEATEIGTITPETYAKVLAFIREKHIHHLAAVVLAGFGAVRSDEIHGKRGERDQHGELAKRQTWEDIDLARRHLNVSVAKKNTPAWRLVSLCDAAVEWLSLCPNQKGFVCQAGAMEKVRAVLIEAGFQLPDNCFRHSAISYKIGVTSDKPATATWAGNSVSEIDRRYRRPMTKEASEAWFSIRPKHCPRQAGECGLEA